MKWYLLSHFLNLYIMPMGGYFILAYLYMGIDMFAYEEALFFGYIPLGCFLISFIYGLRKKKSPFIYCFACSFLCIPLAFIDTVSGSGIINHLSGAVFMYYTYFAIALMGYIAGLITNLGYNAIKRIWVRTKKL